ncbi:MAG: DUF2892 domain-containing protein [Candidatus Aminicenantes bacterium]|nr:DUF2892 domain-containing protein [Candidatus Aminicenantes bacterium]
MNTNMGSADRLIRLVAAVVFAVLVFAGVVKGTWGWIFAVLAAVFVLTSLIGFCPLYVPFRISTKSKTK